MRTNLVSVFADPETNFTFYVYRITCELNTGTDSFAIPQALNVTSLAALDDTAALSPSFGSNAIQVTGTAAKIGKSALVSLKVPGAFQTGKMTI